MSNLFKHSLVIKPMQTMLDITSYVNEDIKSSNIKNGIVVVYCPHTTAGITINENADPDVRFDLQAFINKLIPESHSLYEHSLEGLDDMPAHIKSSILGQNLTIPISRHTLNLGTWQGIYLCEFRNHGGPRSFVLTIIE